MAAETLRWRIPEPMRPRRRARAFSTLDLPDGAVPGDTLRWPPRPASPRSDVTETWSRWTTDFAADGGAEDDIVEFS